MFDFTSIKLTPATLKLFLLYAEDAGNWSGTPLVGGNVGGSKADRGNITHMKTLGLVTTFEEHEPGQGKCTWMQFTALGCALANYHGISIGGWDDKQQAEADAIRGGQLAEGAAAKLAAEAEDLKVQNARLDAERAAEKAAAAQPVAAPYIEFTFNFDGFSATQKFVDAVKTNQLGCYNVRHLGTVPVGEDGARAVSVALHPDDLRYFEGLAAGCNINS
jgi:hypothetical protein